MSLIWQNFTFAGLYAVWVEDAEVIGGVAVVGYRLILADEVVIHPKNDIIESSVFTQTALASTITA